MWLVRGGLLDTVAKNMGLRLNQVFLGHLYCQEPALGIG